MGGDILVNSKLGVGSTFEIYLLNKTTEDILKPEVIKLDFNHHGRFNHCHHKLEIKQS